MAAITPNSHGTSWDIPASMPVRSSVKRAGGAAAPPAPAKPPVAGPVEKVKTVAISAVPLSIVRSPEMSIRSFRAYEGSHPCKNLSKDVLGIIGEYLTPMDNVFKKASGVNHGTGAGVAATFEGLEDIEDDKIGSDEALYQRHIAMTGRDLSRTEFRQQRREAAAIAQEVLIDSAERQQFRAVQREATEALVGLAEVCQSSVGLLASAQRIADLYRLSDYCVEDNVLGSCLLGALQNFLDGDVKQISQDIELMLRLFPTCTDFRPRLYPGEVASRFPIDIALSSDATPLRIVLSIIESMSPEALSRMYIDHKSRMGHSLVDLYRKVEKLKAERTILPHRQAELDHSKAIIAAYEAKGVLVRDVLVKVEELEKAAAASKEKSSSKSTKYSRWNPVGWFS